MQAATALLEHRAPEKHRAGEWDQAKQRAQKIIPAIHERVLQPDVKHRDVFGDRAHARARNRNRNEKMSSTSTIMSMSTTITRDGISKNLPSFRAKSRAEGSC